MNYKKLMERQEKLIEEFKNSVNKNEPSNIFSEERKNIRMKEIKGFEGEYAVTEDGRVYSIRYKRYLKNAGKNYQRVSIHNKSYYVHRLVAEAFIPNPNNLPEINHKDENPHNNSITNLEWCNRTYNINYGNRNKKVSESERVRVYCVELDRYFNNYNEVIAATGVSRDSVSKVVRGTYKSIRGYHFLKVEK